MATIVLITPGRAVAGDVPPALQLLDHTIERVSAPNLLTSPSNADLAVVDARTDLAGARSVSRELVTHPSSIPSLLLIGSSALSIVNPDWGIGDFILADASPAEFEARIRLLLATRPERSTIVGGHIVIDEDAYTVTVGGRPLDLTYTEFELLKCMVLHPGHVLTREFLLSEVWGYDYYGGTRTVDVHIRRLRAKLGPEHDGCIGTVRNVGYRFSPAH